MWKDYAFLVKCNDCPQRRITVVAENYEKAKIYAKDMYAHYNSIYADDRYNVWEVILV